jgi:hypothetical protein
MISAIFLKIAGHSQNRLKMKGGVDGFSYFLDFRLFYFHPESSLVWFCLDIVTMTVFFNFQ